jgi:hypothetical protein
MELSSAVSKPASQVFPAMKVDTSESTPVWLSRGRS